MLAKPSEPWCQTADRAALRGGYAAASEMAIRAAVEEFARQRWPEARICHEMVMGAGTVRADVVAIDHSHIVAFEIKGEYDNTTRLLHQVGMYQLCVPEVWMVVPVGRHAEDARILRYLLPSVGLLVGTAQSGYDMKNFQLHVEAEPSPFNVVPKMMLEMLWRSELAAICDRTRCYAVSAKTTRSHMIAALSGLPLPELRRETCTELRARDALWRADDPIRESK